MAERVQNQDQHFVEKGLHVFGPSETSWEDVGQMAITRESMRGGAPADMRTFTAESDIIEVLPDGRHILLLRKGQSVTMAEAIKKGYVKVEPKDEIGPKERKPKSGPTETK